MKAIYSGFSTRYWHLVAKFLFNEANWQPVYWVGEPAIEPVVKSEYPDAVFHSVFDAVKGIPAREYASRREKPLDKHLLHQFAVQQLALLKMMDRIDALGSFGYHDRVRLLYTLMRYWRAVLDDFAPDVVVFSVIPHMVYDYVLYEYCKQRGIKTLMFESIPVCGMSILMDDFEQPTTTARLYQKLLDQPSPDDVILSDNMEDYLRGLRGDYREAPEYVRRIYKEEPYKGLKAPRRSFWAKITDLERWPQYVHKQVDVMRRKIVPPANYLKQPGKKLEDSNMGSLEYRIFRGRSRARMRALIKYYHRLAPPVDFEKPYIYVALSFQPERTTSPMGSVYVDQLLMIDLLSKTIPSGWHLYVKEHPFQFTPSMFFRAQSGRNRTFYNDIAALPNASLVPMEIDSYRLIDNAQAVAAVTGTVGWETVHRGKPALIFGYPWYRGCEGTFHIDTRDDLLQALDMIQGGYRVDAAKLRLFSYALEQTSVRATVERHLRIETMSDEEVSRRLAQALIDFEFENEA